MLKAVLFDMDGVIVDTEPLHQKAYYGMFNELDIQVTESHYQSFTGQSTLNVCKQLCNYFNINSEPQELVMIKRRIFNELFINDPSLELLDGVLDLIKDYHKNNITMVLASSASMGTINSVFERFDLNPYFKAKLSGADLKASKPHPEIFIKAAEVSSFPKEHCMVIEDSTNGIKAAKTAGIFCVGYKSVHSKNQNYDLADKVITNFKSISYKNMKNSLNVQS